MFHGEQQTAAVGFRISYRLGSEWLESDYHGVEHRATEMTSGEIVHS